MIGKSDFQFHRLTVESEAGPGGEVPLWKTYATSPRYPLLDPPDLAVPFGELLQRRRSRRAYDPGKALTLEQVSALCFATVGVTGERRGIPLRTYPSAGARQPLELYVLAERVQGLPQGLFHYNPLEHTLEHLAEGELLAPLVTACWDQEFLAEASAIFVLTVVYARTRSRYGYRAYRYVHLDAGAAAQNLYLACEAMGLGTVFVGAFQDDALAHLLGVDPDHEFPVAVLPIGYPLERP